MHINSRACTHSFNAHTYTYVYVSTRSHKHVSIHTSSNKHVSIHIRICIHVLTCWLNIHMLKHMCTYTVLISKHSCPRIYTYTYVCSHSNSLTHTHTHVCTHTRTLTYTHTYIYIHTYIPNENNSVAYTLSVLLVLC